MEGLPLLLGFGNPTVDVTVEVPTDEVATFGLAVGGDSAGCSAETKARAVARALAHPARIITPGGSALNSMRVAAFAGGGLRVAFLGAVGVDAEAELLRASMTAAGVEALLREVSGARTGSCASVVDAASKDRALAVVRGAAEYMVPAFLETDAVAHAMLEAAVVYCTSFVLSTPDRAACATLLAEAAAARGAIFALNLSSAGILPKVADKVQKLLPYCSYVFGNQSELTALAALSGWPSEASDDGDAARARCLAAELKEGGMVVCTRGSAATLIARQVDVVDWVPVPTVPREDWVDTNGCGDSFVGGFLSELARGGTVERCAAQGHRCAGAILCRRGCDLTAPIPPL